MSDILFELGFEEIPVLEIETLYEYFDNNIRELIRVKDIKVSSIDTYSTPRRIILLIKDLPKEIPTKSIRKKGPPVNVFFDKDGNITKQGSGFLKSKNIKNSDIEKEDGFVFYNSKEGGEQIIDIVKNTIEHTIKSVPFKKTMKWPGSDIAFSRPIRWILFLNNKNIEQLEIAGVKASNITYGNRSVGNKKLIVKSIDNYFKLMKENYVTCDIYKREEQIFNGWKSFAEIYGIDPVIDNELILENIFLTEFPVVLKEDFDKRFLNLPEPIITAALKQHQRYFATKKNGKQSNSFIFISNNPEADFEILKKNNKRVLTARLEDAEFYYKSDLKRSINDYRTLLNDIIFYDKLGTYGDKIDRTAILASFTDSNYENKNIDFKELALISKFDIATDMIKDGKEFTKLQGIIGYHYALKMGIPKSQAIVSKEHYYPRTKNDKLMPLSYKSIVLSITDKVDNITGAFIAGYKPTGNKDIMAVRRDALALIYLLDRENIHIDLKKLIAESLTLYNISDKEIISEIVLFIKTRIENYFSEEHKIPVDILRCVLSVKDIIIPEILKKSMLINHEKTTEDFKTLIIGIKRVSNILKAAKASNIIYSIDIKALTNNSNQTISKYEKLLFAKSQSVKNENIKFQEKKEFNNILEKLLSLRQEIDNFFDNVLVMDENEKLRQNRLNLLKYIEVEFNKFGDFSKIVIEGEKQEER